METIKVVFILSTILFIGIMLFYGAICLTEKGMQRKIEMGEIFKGFSQKIWMTAGLGSVFFCLYLLIVALGSYFDDQSRLSFFFWVYEHPIVFVYLGLFTFMTLSTSVIFVRKLIKYFYNTRKF
jgi:uncharacterized integral membrane protein